MSHLCTGYTVEFVYDHNTTKVDDLIKNALRNVPAPMPRGLGMKVVISVSPAFGLDSAAAVLKQSVAIEHPDCYRFQQECILGDNPAERGE